MANQEANQIVSRLTQTKGHHFQFKEGYLQDTLDFTNVCLLK